MKKWIALFITLILCVSVLFGCADVQKKYCRVVCVREDGMILDIEQLGYVYVKTANGDFAILSTVVMEFSESDLKPANGTFLKFDGSEQNYSYIIETPKSIRLADPTAGEPTFG